MKILERLFHQHEWGEGERFYTGSAGNFNVRWGTQSDAERLAFGVTTIKYICADCGAVKTEEILGESVSEGGRAVG